jgi:hypothetical protein
MLESLYITASIARDVDAAMQILGYHEWRCALKGLPIQAPQSYFCDFLVMRT